jgi:hypothetical protein
MAGLFDIFSNKDQQQAANDQIGGINQGLGDLSNYYGQGRDAINQNYGEALKPFQQNFTRDTAGADQLAKLLGFGPGGSGDIQNTLRNMPGYQFTLDQGNQNLLRNQAATGQLNSGATNIDLQNYGQGMADKNYSNYVNQLMPFLGAAGNDASGIAGVRTGQGNALNSSLMNEGNAYMSGDIGKGRAQGNADMANLDASKNMWGALSGAANLFGAFL